MINIKTLFNIYYIKFDKKSGNVLQIRLFYKQNKNVSVQVLSLAFRCI